jgi:hypothetical protein
VPGKALGTPDLTSYKSSFQYFYIFSAFFIGQIITANVFSNVADIINSLNASENKYQEIRDDHRLIDYFYKLDTDTNTLASNYYSYLWLKHKEDIYGNELFPHLSKGMIKSFTRAMIPGYEYMIKDFMNLTSNDNRFIIYIISILTKYIAIPYERIVSQGSVIRGLFFLYNGRVFTIDEPEINSKKYIYEYNFEKDSAEIKKNAIEIRTKSKRLDLEETYSASKLKMMDKLENKKSKIVNADPDKSGERTIFPLDSIFIKTGRAIETIYCKTYCELFYISLKTFDNNLLINYPNEMHKLSKTSTEIGTTKAGKDYNLLKIVLEHSYRSVGKYYESEFNLGNMWIEVPIIIPKLKLKYFAKTNNRDKLNSINPIGLMEIDFKCTKLLLSSNLNKEFSQLDTE